MIVAQNVSTVNATMATEQIAPESFESAMDKITYCPGYVPPVSWFKMGRLALRKGYTPQSSWPALMVQGWEFEGPRCYAEAMSAL
jgi:hypothetical protein